MKRWVVREGVSNKDVDLHWFYFEWGRKQRFWVAEWYMTCILTRMTMAALWRSGNEMKAEESGGWLLCSSILKMWVACSGWYLWSWWEDVYFWISFEGNKICGQARGRIENSKLIPQFADWATERLEWSFTDYMWEGWFSLSEFLLVLKPSPSSIISLTMALPMMKRYVHTRNNKQCETVSCPIHLDIV